MHTRAGTRMHQSSQPERTGGRRSLRAAVVAMAVTLGIGVGGIAQAGVGISPVIIEFDDALRGGSYQRTLQLSNTDPDLPATFTVQATGEIAEWLSVSEPDEAPATEFEVASDSRLSLVVQLDVPADAANAEYEGALEVLGSVADGSDGSAGVQLGGLVIVELRVTGTEIRDGSVVDYQIGAAEVGVDQRFTAVIENRGNVLVLPEMEVVITRDGALVETLSTEGEAWVVQADTTDSVTVTWPTSELAAGDYLAAFRVTDTAGNEPVLLGEREVPFRLEPLGTFTRSGQLTDLRVISAVALDTPIIVEATFNNTGRIDTVAVLEAQLRRDGILLEVAQSLDRTILEGGTEELTVTFELDEPGTYEVEGVVNYDGFLSDSSEVRFTVDPAGTVTASASTGDSGTDRAIIVAGAAALTVVVVAFAWLLTRRRRDGGTAQQRTPRQRSNSPAATETEHAAEPERAAVGASRSAERRLSSPASER
jgi:hypothetical protein